MLNNSHDFIVSFSYKDLRSAIITLNKTLHMTSKYIKKPRNHHIAPNRCTHIYIGLYVVCGIRSEALGFCGCVVCGMWCVTYHISHSPQTARPPNPIPYTTFSRPPDTQTPRHLDHIPHATEPQTSIPHATYHIN